jgi:hypothetical protein
MLLNKDFFMQGGVRNYLGKTEEVKNAPKYWKSSPTSPKTELSYITDAEKELLLKANLHGSLINQQPNIGASGILSFDGWGDASDGFGSSSSSSSSSDSGGYDEAGTTTPSYSFDSIGTTGYDDAGTTTPSYSFDSIGTTGYDDANVIAQQATQPKFDPDTEYYQTLTNRLVPQFDQEGNYIGVKNTGVGTATGKDYNTVELQGFLLDSNVSEKNKIEMLNQIQGIVNSKFDVGKPGVDDEAKQYIQQNLEGVLTNIKSDPFYSQYAEQIDPEASTYIDEFTNKPITSFIKSGLSPTKVVLNTLVDAYKNEKALQTLGYTGQRLSPDYAETGGILETPEYLLGTGGTPEINQAITQLPGLIGGEQLPKSVFESFFGTIGQAGADIMNRYNQAKSNVNTITYAPNISPSYGIFQDAKNRGLI